MRIVSVNYLIDDEVEKKLDELLKMAKDFKHPDTGKRSFENYDKDNIFRFALEMGSSYHAIDQLELLKKLLSKGGIT